MSLSGSLEVHEIQMKPKAATFALAALMAAFLAGCGPAGLLNPVSGERGTEFFCPVGSDTTPLVFAEQGTVDILIVMDSSGSMAAEQALMREAFPALVRSLLTGIDIGTGERVHNPVRDLHVGVVSADMGTGGYSVTTCEEDPLLGDDGLFQHTPHGTDCAALYPDYLTYSMAGDEPDEAAVDSFAADAGCIGLLGTQGCGFEQQLEAAWKALAVHALPGGPNEGFLRDEAILMILFVTDEEDCSAADPTLFDVSTYPYSINLGCYYQATKLHTVDHYAAAFRALKADPDQLLLGFIVGVPPDERSCNGLGSDIGGCLEYPAMQETVRADNELLEYVCRYPKECTPPDPPSAGNCISEAFPARRFVQLAQAFGRNAYVHSICTGDFSPAFSVLSEKLGQVIKTGQFQMKLPVEKDPADDCRCRATCSVVEVLSNKDSCPAGKPAYDGNHDGTPDVFIDDDLFVHTLCEIPQAGTVILPDEGCGATCTDPDVTYSKDPTRAGWWYDPNAEDPDTGGISETIFFGDIVPEYGSTVEIRCCVE